ncbi:Transmembrane protein [Balamuthia mandrillaris]
MRKACCSCYSSPLPFSSSSLPRFHPSSLLSRQTSSFLSPSLRSQRPQPLRFFSASSPLRRSSSSSSSSSLLECEETAVPRPTSSITKEADQAFRKQSWSWFDWKSALFGLSVGSLLLSATYVYHHAHDQEVTKLKQLLRRQMEESAEGVEEEAEAAEGQTDAKKKDDDDRAAALEQKKQPRVVLTPEAAKLLKEKLPKSLGDLTGFPYPVYNAIAWTLAATLTTLFAWSRGKWKWYRRHFMGRVNFSLNLYHDNTLKFRTLFERSLYDMMFRNHAAVKVVANAAAKTEVGKPFLMIAPEENWYVLNNILNEISSSCMMGFLQEDCGIPVKLEWYVFGLTCEKDEGVWNRKIRVMLISQRLLERIPDLPPPSLESAHHRVRWRTLQKMSDLWRAQNQDEAIRSPSTPILLSRVQLAIPIGLPGPNAWAEELKEEEGRETDQL